MKVRLVALLGLFCIAFIASVADGGKKPKPPKPGETSAECIVFSGGLEGSAAVDGCCPNAGPYPAYTMNIPNGLGHIASGTYDGHIFMNYFGVGKNRNYIVQFWTEGFGIEVIGGVVDDDKKDKVLTVTFTNETCTDFVNGLPLPNVSFVLVRDSDGSSCG